VCERSSVARSLPEEDVPTPELLDSESSLDWQPFTNLDLFFTRLYR
jgi:hypothetical protein